MIHYSAGNEHNPMDHRGRVELTIDADGKAQLEHHHLGGRDDYEGAVAPADVDRLQAALERAGFPLVIRHAIPPDSRLCSLDVDGRSILVARAAPEYDEAFAILDSVVAELSA